MTDDDVRYRVTFSGLMELLSGDTCECRQYLMLADYEHVECKDCGTVYTVQEITQYAFWHHLGSYIHL